MKPDSRHAAKIYRLFSNGSADRKIFFLLFVAIFSSTLGNGLVVPLLPGYAHQMGATNFLIGLIFGIFSLSRMAMVPVVGHLSDTRGRKPFITSGLFAYFLASVLFIFADSVFLVILVRFVQGGAAAMILPVAQAYAGDISAAEKEGSAMGFIQMAMYGGLSTGPLIGGIIKDSFGINTAFMMMGLVCLAGFMLSLVFLPPVKKEASASMAGKPGLYTEILKNRRVAGLLVFMLAYIICIGSLWSFIPLIADVKFNLPTISIGIIITLCVFISAVLMKPMGAAADRYNKKSLLIAGGLLIALSMLCLVLAKQAWHLYLASILVGIGGGVSVPSVMALAVIAGRASGGMASMMSLLTVAHSLGMITGPVLIAP
ncbi:MAG: MFS transporter, partial [Desulfobacterales bacterium]|nr:MFS transporter [Desulfobacterales bacterium]